MRVFKKNNFLIIIIFCFFLTFSFVKAQEIEYPTQFGQEPTKTLPNFISYIYMFAGGGAGFLAMLMLIIGSIQLITATGNPSKIYNARRRILGAITGLILVLFSYSIIAIINPDLLVLKDLNVEKPAQPKETIPQMIDRIRRGILKGTTGGPNQNTNQPKAVYDYGTSVDCYLDNDTESKFLINGVNTEWGGDGNNKKIFCCTAIESDDENYKPSCQKLCEIEANCARVEGEGNCDDSSQDLYSCAHLKAIGKRTDCEENKIYCY